MNNSQHVMKMYWTTDVHIEFLSDKKKEMLYEKMVNKTVLITGDIAVSYAVIKILHEIESIASKLYFVLGNHDFYGSSIDDVKSLVSKEFPNSYLTTLEGVKIGEKLLIGSDGWYDGKIGSYNIATEITDFTVINDFMGLTKAAIFTKMAKLAEIANKSLITKLVIGLQTYDEIILATHVPPFKGNSTYEGVISSNAFLPFFCNFSLGEMLKETMSQCPDKKLTVLSGHTHDCSKYVYGNILSITKLAEYGTISPLQEI